MSLLFSAAEANSTSAASWVGSSERNFSYEGVGRVLRQIAEFLRIRTVIIEFFRAIAVAGAGALVLFSVFSYRAAARCSGKF